MTHNVLVRLWLESSFLKKKMPNLNDWRKIKYNFFKPHQLPASAGLYFCPEAIHVLNEVGDEAKLGQKVRDIVFGNGQAQTVRLSKWKKLAKKLVKMTEA